ncbi:hypothetical protein ADIARSV_1435 [Arcticibacter svalbardensis MN12-7]|uniref:Protein-glutamine gamma-glutamyltransferase-like C-terminal domain-containing protein n=1 Tax=Arcticibacter svalbardensis MN12-7 TaxID=1150600 RepID=R9H2J1_9SPHI|nr:DUF4129 domain-containing protein [Arcticibacter svalbardensis]EOR95434.1 hypothetical protein ADIARSV_1435 [Arcticibacter svalbardensis MN12-7]
MMHKRLLIFCILICLHLNLKAGITTKSDGVKKVVVLRADTSRVILRSFNVEALKIYKRSPGFNYSTQTPASNWWGRFWQWVWLKLEKLLGRKETKTNSNAFITYLLIAAAVGFTVYVVMKILGLDHIFKRTAKQAGLAYDESIDDIKGINFDEAINNAVNLHNYRLAIRFLYLQSLKQLDEAQLISWQIGKTNSTYINELTNMEHKRSFGLLTRQFEFVWYGNFPVNGQSFEEINTLFIDFKKMLS